MENAGRAGINGSLGLEERTALIRYSLLKNRDYLLLWSGQVISTLGSAASWVIYPLLMLEITRSPASAGIAAGLRGVPYLLFSLPAGALLDRWDRKFVMIVCNIGRAVVIFAVAGALWWDVLLVEQLYVTAFVEGTFAVFFNIAQVAALPRVVSATQLPQATAQNEAAFSAANIVGPSFGTLLYNYVSTAAPLVVDALSFVISTVTLVLIKAEFRSTQSAARANRNLGREIAEGLVWLWKQPLVRYMAFLTGSMNLVNAGSMLIIIMLAKQMGASAFEIGLIFTVGGIGGIAGSFLGGQIQKRFSFGQVIICLVWLDAVVFPLYAVAPTYFLLGSICAVTYFVAPVYNVVQMSYRLAIIPDALQGRVNSTFRLLAFGFMPVGAIVSGFLLERIGPSATVIVFTLWYVVLGILTTCNPYVRQAPALARAVGA